MKIKWRERGRWPGLENDRRGRPREHPRSASGDVNLTSLPDTSGQKVPIAQLPVVHAQNILPDMSSSGHVTSGSTTTQHHHKWAFVRAHILLNASWDDVVFFVSQFICLCICKKQELFTFRGQQCSPLAFGGIRVSHYFRLLCSCLPLHLSLTFIYRL
jgi:hypothetical protein